MRDRIAAYRPAAKTTARYRVLYGGAGSGKSVFVAQDEIERAARDGQRVLVVRKVHRTLRHSTYQLFIDIISGMDRLHMVDVRKTEMRIDFPSGGAILHAGLDDPEKIKSIAGIDRIWIEEANELSKNDFQLLDLRLRGESKFKRQISITFNPVPSWIKGYLVERTDEDSPHAEDVYVQKTTYRDNPFLDDTYGRILENLPEDLRKIYESGEWGEYIKGLIYPSYQVMDSEIEKPDFYGLDFGYNAPSCLMAMQNHDPDMHVQELLYQSHLTNTDLIGELNVLIKDKRIPIYCDSAEPARIEELVRAGFNAWPADKSVNDGIDTVKRYVLHIHRGSQNTLNEIQEYKWDEDRKTGEAIDKPVKRKDHAMDSVRYGVHTHLAEIGNTWGMWGA